MPSISALSGVFAWRYFPAALPLINLDVKMTRGDALTQAAAIADRLQLAPAGAQRAALFAHDGATQNFVELEAGGKPAFTRMLTGDALLPVLVGGAAVQGRARPPRRACGFVRTARRTDSRARCRRASPAPALDAAAARAIAETSARTDWAIDFAPYKLLEQSQVQMPNGRIDHSFVYEREQEKLGDGRYRMRLGVAGDRLSELTHLVYIPEAFERRFQEMRFANNAIAEVAGIAAGALYGIGGCVLGVLWLLRRRALDVAAGAGRGRRGRGAECTGTGRQRAAGVVRLRHRAADLGVLGSAIRAGGGWFSSVAVSALGLVFMAAESLSRRAFPEHPQLWRLWSRRAAASPAVLGRTAAGYLAVPIELALIAAFYFVDQPVFRLVAAVGNADRSQHPGQRAAGAGADRHGAAGRVHGGMPVPCGAAVDRGAARQSLRPSQAASIAIALVLQALVFGARARQLPRFPVVFASGRARRPGLRLGIDFRPLRAR